MTRSIFQCFLPIETAAAFIDHCYLGETVMVIKEQTTSMHVLRIMMFCKDSNVYLRVKDFFNDKAET